MSKRTIISVTILGILLFLTWFLSDVNKQDEAHQKKIKVSLREVGNQLLIKDKDTTSLVMPIIAISNSKYLLSFQNQLSLEPEILVTLIEKTFKKAEISTNYLVEVVHCSDKEIAYSYQIKKTVEKNIIPCKGRFLPKNCYQIEVNFVHKNSFLFNNTFLIYIFLISIFIVQFFFFKSKNKEHNTSSKQLEKTTFTTIGSFQFYPTQNKLVKKAKEIRLSRKECELLAIFVANPNTIIKRDELTKKVWEDNGVFVGRSLDTYISKLRKKLKEDATIKLINVHGVGYKLETNNRV